jgi:hypothetical protein
MVVPSFAAAPAPGVGFNNNYAPVTLARTDRPMSA